MSALASVVIPAHNEERSIVSTLETLRSGLTPGALDVVVVCNGCTDATADLVRRRFPDVQVLEIGEPSKAAAVAAGNDATTVFPRVHLDADVRVTGASILAMVKTLEGGAVHAVAPRRVLDRSGCSPLVNWYYDVWEQLPQVREGLFGRGAFALSQEGQQRVSALPRLMSDDLVVSEAFRADERAVVPQAESVVVPPRRTDDLLRRRVRVVTGNAQAAGAGARTDASTTRIATLVELSRRSPRLALRMPVFLGITVLARLRARRAIRAGDFDTWLRDESSRG